MNKNMLDNWPFLWWGILAEDIEATPQWPLLDEVADPSWNPRDKGKLVRYLKKCPVLLTGTQRGPQICRLCGEECHPERASTFRSDDVWVWPVGIEHFIEAHDLCLPAPLIQHIRERKYRAPRKVRTFEPDSRNWPAWAGPQTASLSDYRVDPKPNR